MRTSLTALLLFAAAPAAFAQQTFAPPLQPSALTLSTASVEPVRFVAAHGRRALLMGYASTGLEAWAYPFQLFRNYRLQFLPQGDTTAIDAVTVLRRIDYAPDEIIRTYIGPDFLVREHLFVPLDRPGVILSYQVEGRRPVDLNLSFLPTLNLMWPGALGGQDLRWSDALSGYVISEITTGFRAVIASPQQIAHSEVVNGTLRQDLTQSLVLHPSAGYATVFAGLDDSASAEGAAVRLLEQQEASLRAASRAHVEAVLATGLRIHTPDEAINRALAWSKLALDQAWVCNPRLGCGIVGGYGPSRGMRRPQYAWFFAGDGLVATDALLADGDLSRARDELAFILKYRDPTNGMIWHELSQSAGFIDWKKYPYMYVHVDITFDFLSTLARYYQATGDLALLHDHWAAIEAAYRYCRSVVNPETALPQIPANKEGGNEQDRMSEDVGLSASWVSASEAYRQLATATGHAPEAAEAAQASEAARKAIAARYWDNQKQFWIAGYSGTGKPISDERPHAGLFGQHLFTAAQESAALDHLASADFETDWGTRSMSVRSPHFDPDSYASGSVSAFLTSEMAAALWRQHRPAAALAIWHTILPWLQLDSLGHMHEVLAGDFFHQQVESVPEQTWSSAGLLDATVHGLFGIDVDAPQHRLTLAPHLDPAWRETSIENIAVANSRISTTLGQEPGEISLVVDNKGDPVHLSFEPELPLGATAVRTTVNGRSAHAVVEQNPHDEHARVEFDLPSGTTHCQLRYTGGVQLLFPAVSPAVGSRSTQPKLTSIQLKGHALDIEADVSAGSNNILELQTPWRIQAVDGGVVTPLGDHLYGVSFPPALSENRTQYVHRHIGITFQTH